MRHATANRPVRRVKHLTAAARTTARFAVLVGVFIIATPIAGVLLIAAWIGIDVGVLTAGNFLSVAVGLGLGYGSCAVRSRQEIGAGE